MNTETKYLISTNSIHDLENLLEHYELLPLEDARHRMVKFGGLQPDKPSQLLERTTKSSNGVNSGHEITPSNSFN